MRFIRPSLIGKVGVALPKRRLPPPELEPQRTDATQISTDELKSMLKQNAGWQDALDAAQELGKRVGRLSDIEALGDIVRFCQDDGQRNTAIEKLVAVLPSVQDPRVLEAIALNSDDKDARQKAIALLGSRAEDVTTAFTLVHIALIARHKLSRVLAVNMLAGREDALNVISKNSEFEDTREYAKSMMDNAD